MLSAAQDLPEASNLLPVFSYKKRRSQGLPLQCSFLDPAKLPRLGHEERLSQKFSCTQTFRSGWAVLEMRRWAFQSTEVRCFSDFVLKDRVVPDFWAWACPVNTLEIQKGTNYHSGSGNLVFFPENWGFKCPCWLLSLFSVLRTKTPPKLSMSRPIFSAKEIIESQNHLVGGDL